MITFNCSPLNRFDFLHLSINNSAGLKWVEVGSSTFHSKLRDTMIGKNRGIDRAIESQYETFTSHPIYIYIYKKKIKRQAPFYKRVLKNKQI